MASPQQQPYTYPSDQNQIYQQQQQQQQHPQYPAQQSPPPQNPYSPPPPQLQLLQCPPPSTKHDPTLGEKGPQYYMQGAPPYGPAPEGSVAVPTASIGGAGGPAEDAAPPGAEKGTLTLFGKRFAKKTVVIASVLVACLLILIIGLGAGLGSKSSSSRGRGRLRGGGGSGTGDGSGDDTGSGGGYGNDYGYGDQEGGYTIDDGGDMDEDHLINETQNEALDNAADYFGK